MNIEWKNRVTIHSKSIKRLSNRKLSVFLHNDKKLWKGTDIMEKLVYNVQEVAFMLNISKSHAYELIRRNVIPTLEIGKRKVVPKKKFEDWIEGRESQ